jgi:hypothetical protein
MIKTTASAAVGANDIRPRGRSPQVFRTRKTTEQRVFACPNCKKCTQTKKYCDIR